MPCSGRASTDSLIISRLGAPLKASVGLHRRRAVKMKIREMKTKYPRCPSCRPLECWREDRFLIRSAE